MNARHFSRSLPVGLVMSLLMPLAGYAADTDSSSSNGTYQVNFTGSFTNSSCVVSVNDQNKYVNLGEHKVSDFKASGVKSAGVPITITLNNCDISTYKTAAVTMQGTTVEGNSQLLQPTDNGSGQAVAKNLGIEISDSQGKALTLDGNTTGAPLTMHNGDSNNIMLTARYVSTGAVTAGAANATAYFRIVYQ